MSLGQFPPSMPDQVLCKEHLRKHLQRRQQKWMSQRQKSLEESPNYSVAAGEKAYSLDTSCKRVEETNFEGDASHRSFKSDVAENNSLCKWAQDSERTAPRTVASSTAKVPREEPRWCTSSQGKTLGEGCSRLSPGASEEPQPSSSQPDSADESELAVMNDFLTALEIQQHGLSEL